MRHGSPKAWYSGPRGVAHVNSSIKISKKLIGPDYHRLGTTVRPDGTGPYHLGSRGLKKSEKVLQLGFEILRIPESWKFRQLSVGSLSHWTIGVPEYQGPLRIHIFL